jgi:hypothetical protein
MDELNFLAKRLNCFSDTELDTFYGMIRHKGFTEMKDLINATYNLDNYTLVQDFRHIAFVGRTHYHALHGRITETAENSLSRTGLLLHDEDILRAMNHALDSKFLANIKYKEKEDVFTGEALVSNDGFTDILKKLEDTVVKIATELHSGKADANPLIYDKKSPCDYCQAKPVCRKAE